MGANWSKYFRQIPYSCYELGHTWNPSCSASAVEVGLSSFEEALKIYSSVYMVGIFVYLTVMPEFRVTFNPIQTRGTYYAHHITASPPGFENPAASLTDIHTVLAC